MEKFLVRIITKVTAKTANERIKYVKKYTIM